MTSLELQEEEIEVVQAIYGLDEGFNVTEKDNCKVIRASIEAENGKVVVLDVIWPAEYPNVLPTFSLDAFANKSINETAKEAIIKELIEQAEPNEGQAMTFVLIEWLRGEITRLMEIREAEVVNIPAPTLAARPVARPQKLTKAEKRRAAKLGTEAGAAPLRGHNWLDLVRHLSHIPPHRQR